MIRDVQLVTEERAGSLGSTGEVLVSCRDGYCWYLLESRRNLEQQYYGPCVLWKISNEKAAHQGKFKEI